MIRDFIDGDQDRLEANEFSDISGVEDVFSDDNYIKYTLEDDDEIKCIMCWYEHRKDHYAIFFLMPNGVGFSHARQIKRFLKNQEQFLNPKTCTTYSVDCDVLNRWHEFFGFTKEGDGVIIEDKKFNKWIIKWE